MRNLSLFGSVELTKNADPDKYKCSGFSIGFDSCSEFSFIYGSLGGKVHFFGTDISSSMHNNNKNKNILIFGEGPTKALDGTSLIAEAKYPNNFTQ